MAILTSDIMDNISEYKRLSERKNIPIVSVFGLMNSGKSYLLNMLSENYELEYFKTNDIRETSELKFFETNDYILVDTPGLDANVADDKLAFEGMRMSDVVLFVHQPQGELEKNEIEFIRHLKSSFGSYADKNIAILISKIDSEDKHKIEQIERRIKDQCKSELDVNMIIKTISSTRLHKGINTNKDGMVKESNIEEIKSFIKLAVMDFKKSRIERESIFFNYVNSKINEIKESLYTERKLSLQKIEDRFDNFRQCIIDLEKMIKSSKSDYNRYKNRKKKR